MVPLSSPGLFPANLVKIPEAIANSRAAFKQKKRKLETTEKIYSRHNINLASLTCAMSFNVICLFFVRVLICGVLYPVYTVAKAKGKSLLSLP